MAVSLIGLSVRRSPWRKSLRIFKILKGNGEERLQAASTPAGGVVVVVVVVTDSTVDGGTISCPRPVNFSFTSVPSTALHRARLRLTEGVGGVLSGVGGVMEVVGWVGEGFGTVIGC